MERVQRLAQFWSWLPAFRVVAETQHLPTASKALHVSPSALSRTIRLLEDDIGQPLFDRVGRRIELNEAGRRLLAAVRDSMRLVDEGYAAVQGSRFMGKVKVSAPGPLVSVYLLPALQPVLRDHPELVPEIVPAAEAEVATSLLRGRLDVAVLDGFVSNDELTVEPIGEMTHALYAGPDHPLAKRIAKGDSPSRDDVAAHPFVAPPPDARGRPVEPWPEFLPRRVGLVVHRMQLGIEACQTGQYLTVLPDRVAERAGLVRIPFEPIAPTTLFIAHRPSLAVRSRADVVADAIRDYVARIS